MGRLQNDEFLKQISSLLEKNAGKSSIYITQKRLSHDIEAEIGTEPFDDIQKDVKPTVFKSITSTKQYPVLVRVTDGDKDKKKKVKLSTVVRPEDLDKFWLQYTNILKAGFPGLKKKSKKKKAKRT
ncbi:DEKNAAC101562 [Brettanomyces naardenensis]|uniref:Signal recognition particle subunit SRP14 n=1 Tax=Brettanomyces naardenensis TaxID=13370 RepID=A0A448YI89_BRENA|nr:DEKNAAC101562 [Brettanomyces naardenensis]